MNNKEATTEANIQLGPLGGLALALFLVTICVIWFGAIALLLVVIAVLKVIDHLAKKFRQFKIQNKKPSMLLSVDIVKNIS